MESLKVLATKISEAYDKLFRTWTRLVIFFLAYFLVLRFLPDKLASIIGWSFIAFIIIAIIGRHWRRKDSK